MDRMLSATPGLGRSHYGTGVGTFVGESIISNWWILTASHCVEKDRSPRGYSVVVGN